MMSPVRSPDVRLLWLVDILGALLLLVVMIWKPGH